MRASVESCPGGVAIVIPEALAVRAGLRSGEVVELEESADRIVVRRAGTETLGELLSRVSPDNLPGEWAAGPPAGAEVL
jgi:antitoxin component of MazEF toxin-antitoxin module